MKNTLKILWILLGFLCLGLGTVGIIVPILPPVLFLFQSEDGRTGKDPFREYGLGLKYMRKGQII